MAIELTENNSPLLKSKTIKWCLLIFVIAAVIRMIGLGWGLANQIRNQTLHPDEEVNWRYSQHIKPTELNFTPGRYNYGTFYLTLLNVASDITGAYAGPPKSTSDWNYIARCEYSGRILSLIAGSGLAVFAFLAALRLSNLAGGMCAGLAIAFSPGLSEHSRFATVDMLAAFLFAVSVYYAILIYLEANPIKNDTEIDFHKLRKFAMLGALFAGLSAGTKYSGIVGLIVLIGAVFLCREKLASNSSFWKESLKMVGVSLLAFIVVTPGVLLDSSAFWRDFLFEYHHSHDGHGLVFVGTSNGFLYQLGNLFQGQGLMIVLIGLIGITFGAVKKQKWAFLLALAFLPTYFLIGNSAVKFYRYCIPLSYPISVSFGIISGLAIEKRSKGFPIAALSILGLGGIGGGGLRGDIVMTTAMTSPDSRDTAATYLKEHCAGNQTVGLVSDPWFWSPPLFPDTGMVRMAPFQMRDNLRRNAVHPTVLEALPTDPNERVQWDNSLISSLKPDYITYSDFESYDFARIEKLVESGSRFDPQTTSDVERYRGFQKLLHTQYEQIESIGPGTELSDGTNLPVEDLRYPATTVYIWRKKN